MPYPRLELGAVFRMCFPNLAFTLVRVQVTLGLV